LIILVGLPGSGKSTIGRQLARRLQLPFVDSDQVVEQRLGCAIRTFFEREGEDRFRDIEEAVIDELTASHPGVMATGGGVVLRPANRERMRSRGHVVYLRSSPEELAHRLRHDTQRPLLQVSDPLARLRDLHAARDPLYRDASHVVAESARTSVAAMVRMVSMQLELAGLAEAADAPPGDPGGSSGRTR
jgi:shikimate kinase